MKDTRNSQQTESVLLSDGGVRVEYAVEDHVDDGQTEHTVNEFQGVARRGRKRTFAIRHHRVDGGKKGGDVRVALEQVVQHVGGLDGSSSHRDQLLEFDTSTPTEGREEDERGGGEIGNVVKMGRGGHALTVDADMMNMVMSSTQADLTTIRTPKSNPKRRRQQPQSVRRKSSGLGERLLATQPDPARGGGGGPCTGGMDDFMSLVPAPSQLVQSRTRMRAPATLTQLADSLDERLNVHASMRTGSTVTTLKLLLRSVHIVQGKMTCMCWCDAPMGVLPDHTVVVVMKQMSELDGLVTHSSSGSHAEGNAMIQGHEIIVNKPWLVLDSTTPTVLLCLGEVAHRYNDVGT